MLSYGFDIFDSDEFQDIVLENEEIEDIEIKDDEYPYNVQYIICNKSMDTDIDLIIRKMNYFFSASPVVDKFHINENYTEFREQRTCFVHFFMVDNITVSKLIRFFKSLMNICSQTSIYVVMTDKDGIIVADNLSKMDIIDGDFQKIFSSIFRIRNISNENIYNYLQRLVRHKIFNNGKYVNNLLSCLKLYKAKISTKQF